MTTKPTVNEQLDADTIVAIATAPGAAGIGVIRISGPCSYRIATQICASELKPRTAHYRTFLSSQIEGVENTGTAIDQGIALYFPAPGSFTGEDVVELQAHGGPVVLDSLVKEALTLGARPARAGEFSERAFLNNKIDLAQAEAIADLINSQSEQAARGALNSLQGEFSSHIKTLNDQLVKLRVYVEAALDFPEEEIDFLNNADILASLDTLNETIFETVQRTEQGALLKEGISVAIAGAPNAGKSSLLNALSGYDSAIVTDIAGTTRDVLKESINLDGLQCHLIDTAGLRQSPDAIEQEGIRRAGLEFEKADLILLVIDLSEQIRPLNDLEPAELWPKPVPDDDVLRRSLVVFNKMDRLAGSKGVLKLDDQKNTAMCQVSAKTGQGLKNLRELIKTTAGYQPQASAFTARRRHLDALRKASSLVANGLNQLKHNGAGELLAEDLRQAQVSLEAITGAVSSDELLGEIFSSFCIGK